jgi:1A family penicillin-binding protein
MKLVILFIVVILKSLIWIGDQVIRGVELVGKLKAPSVKLPHLKIRKLKFKTPKLPKFGKPLRTITSELSLIPYRVSIFFSKFKPKKRIKVKRVRPQTIFSTRSLKIMKARYFALGTVFSLIFVFFPFLVAIFLQSLPNPKELTSRDIAQTTKIYDRNGNLLYQIYASQNRTLVPLNSIPKDLVNATIAIEDKDFYHNPGFNILAITRAAIANLRGEPLQGGSTITQQLIKSTLLTPERTIERKVKEIILAFWAERLYSKDEILEMYLNQVPYGGTSWGVEAASETYFGKKVSDLTLSESAFLAGMPKAPTIYTPYGEFPDKWKDRQKEVLNAMERVGYIGKGEKEKAISEELVFLAPQSPIHAPHFVFYIKDLLSKKYGIAAVEKGGLNVTTSLDLKTQQTTQDIVRSEVERSLGFNLSNGAALVTNPKNGDILAMVGSKNFEEPGFGNVNVTTSLRQPGSTIKVVTYSAALQNGFTAATLIQDTPVTFAGNPPYTPVNYDGRFRGNITLRLALGNSINIPAVKTLNRVGVPKMVALAKKMGITTWNNPEKYGLAVTLGAAEVKMTDMAAVYGTLANGGRRVDLDPLLKVTDSKGSILYQKRETRGIQVMDEGIAFIISNILSDNSARALEFGPNSPLNLPGTSVKTGTTDKIRDNWTIGYTKDLLAAVWVGNNSGAPMSGIASGITGAAPIWRNVMVNLIQGSKIERASVPQNVIEKFCLGRREYFIRGTENQIRCAAPSPTPTPPQAGAPLPAN